MATCNDCVHYPACNYKMWCDLFKDKTNFVEVVRCKDCKHAKLDLMEKGLAVCRRPVLKNGQLLPLNLETKYNDYCSYGELKGSERK